MEYINKLLHKALPTRTPSPTSLSGADTGLPKPSEHEVKVRFAREFADAGPVNCSGPESLSSASSFHSLSSTLSTKSSSGICVDSVPQSPNDTVNNSYINKSIPDVDDLISACAEIQLNGDDDKPDLVLQDSLDISPDQTFASATDELIGDLTKDLSFDEVKEDSQNVTRVLESPLESVNVIDRTQEIRDRPILNSLCIRESFGAPVDITKQNGVLEFEESLQTFSDKSGETNDAEERSSLLCEESLNSTVCLSDKPVDSSDLNQTVEISQAPQINQVQETKEIVEKLPSNEQVSNFLLNTTTSVLSSSTNNVELPSISTLSSENSGLKETETSHVTRELIEENTKELTKELTEGDTKELTKELTEGDTKELTKELTEGDTKELSKDSTTEDTKELIEEPTKEDSKNLTTEDTKGFTNEENEKLDSLIGACTLNKTDLWPTIGTTLPESITQGLEESHESNVSHIIKDQSGELRDEPRTCQEESKEVVKEVKEVKKDKEEFKEDKEEFKEVKEEKKEYKEEEEEAAQLSDDRLDVTLTLQDEEDCKPEIEYTDFIPQRQSTSLTQPKEPSIFDELKPFSEEDVNDFFKSQQFAEETDQFVTATSEIFQDPSTFDFLLARSNSKTINRLRAESLYVKFDPLVADVSMLPQGNTTQSISEEQNGKSEAPVQNAGTPKRNPAIAAIDRLLFYSPLPGGTVQKAEEPKEKIEQPMEKSAGDVPLIADINMSKELELVRATVLQLEEELEKQRKKYEVELEKQKKRYEVELEKQKSAYQEKISKLQTQIAEEIESKSQMTVVLEEYEKSISRMLTERERDRTNYEQEKTKLQEELQAANVHLTNTEAAFNDVHQKYERLKGVVSAYKSNESVLKESIQENMETIKGLETRYDQLKNHAMSQLEKANFELDAIKKQHEDETVKLHAMVRKAELKSNSLAELVEQKTKENKELAQILDEVIARVGHQNAE